ncbi:MAG: hypothetical protein KGL62_15725 [Bradyrhizobium sp.]|uniref:hypothetical protein n=1 Tax=Bradyrhizobium sp. TaxID=376 RepID=UPI00238556C8|nr:hypothetical protein [Bradyrhizobium sp.]MDE2603803.1 hypothetical protein [Bradyrhizobium sp.]
MSLSGRQPRAMRRRAIVGKEDASITPGASAVRSPRSAMQSVIRSAEYSGKSSKPQRPAASETQFADARVMAAAFESRAQEHFERILGDAEPSNVPLTGIGAGKEGLVKRLAHNDPGWRPDCAKVTSPL